MVWFCTEWPWKLFEDMERGDCQGSLFVSQQRPPCIVHSLQSLQVANLGKFYRGKQPVFVEYVSVRGGGYGSCQEGKLGPRFNGYNFRL